MNFTGKSYDDLETGDIIRSKLASPKKSRKRKKGSSKIEHTFIVLEIPQKSGSRDHKICVPACCFTSQPPTAQESLFIDLTEYDVPENFFFNKKGNCYLRLSEPSCLKRFEYIGHIGSLDLHSQLWGAICTLVHQSYNGVLIEFHSVCDCELLTYHCIPNGLCEEDSYEYCEIFDHPGVSCIVCSCCGEFIAHPVEEYVVCPNCNQNRFVIIHDGFGNSCECYPNNSPGIDLSISDINWLKDTIQTNPEIKRVGLLKKISNWFSKLRHPK